MHDYLAQKLMDFVKKYNSSLFSFQQENVHTYLSNQSEEEPLASMIYKNSQRLQRLALMQVISDTVCKNLIRIQEINKNDRLLQKSMVGNLH